MLTEEEIKQVKIFLVNIENAKLNLMLKNYLGRKIIKMPQPRIRFKEYPKSETSWYDRCAGCLNQNKHFKPHEKVIFLKADKHQFYYHLSCFKEAYEVYKRVKADFEELDFDMKQFIEQNKDQFAVDVL